MIKSIAKVIVALNSNVRRSQIASGFAWGILLALLPADNLLWLFLFIVSLFLKNNYATQVLVMGIFKLLAPLFSPALDSLGWTVLNLEALRPFFTRIYNLPVAPFTRFNNTQVAGGLCAGVVLWFPVFFGIRALIPVYRKKIVPRIMESKFIKAIKKIPIVSSLTKAVSALSGASGRLV